MTVHQEETDIFKLWEHADMFWQRFNIRAAEEMLI